ncbi:MAG: 3'(2'),5'-bisphosphate nucleotidase CysQ [Rickettsiaceae bacterium]
MVITQFKVYSFMDKRTINEIKNITIKAGEIAMNLRSEGLEIKFKQDRSPVTNADKVISDYIFFRLSKIAPHIPVVCEERPLIDVSNNKQFWLVDPIDGTSSFIDNSAYFTVNIALIDNKQAKYGFIYLPASNKLYYTDANNQLVIEQHGNRTNLNVHNQISYVAVASSKNINQLTSTYLIKHQLSNIISIPSSVKLCLIAESAGDVYPNFGQSMEWDIAAGHALITATGGDLALLSGETMTYAKPDFLNPHFVAFNKKWRHNVEQHQQY